MSQTDFYEKVIFLRPELQYFTRNFTRDIEESHDLIQDTILRALTYRDKFKEDTNMRGWLFTIMRNTFINTYRRKQRSNIAPGGTDRLNYLNVEDQNTFFRAESGTELKEIWKNVISVSEELQTPFKMYVTGYKYNEIAEHLKIPVGTVKNRIFRARKEIQKKLIGYS